MFDELGKIHVATPAQELSKEAQESEKAFNDPTGECPNCNASWQAEPIPEKYRHHYEGTHYSRRIGIYDDELDCTVAIQCPDCKKQFPRHQEVIDAIKVTPEEQDFMDGVDAMVKRGQKNETTH